MNGLKLFYGFFPLIVNPHFPLDHTTHYNNDSNVPTRYDIEPSLQMNDSHILRNTQYSFVTVQS